MSDSSKVKLRRRFRHLRRSLDRHQQAQNAQGLQLRLLQTLLLFRYQHFALYNATDGEISTQPIIAKLWERSKQTALPCLRPSFRVSVHRASAEKRTYSTPKKNQQMHFAAFNAHSRFVRGSYDLLEPATMHAKSPAEFAAGVIFLPLVAFDASGTRLGMGGGYYDRYMSHSKQRNTLRVGLAHAVQESTELLPRDPWDIALDAVITEQRVQTFNNRAQSLLFGRVTTNN